MKISQYILLFLYLFRCHYYINVYNYPSGISFVYTFSHICIINDINWMKRIIRHQIIQKR